MKLMGEGEKRDNFDYSKCLGLGVKLIGKGLLGVWISRDRLSQSVDSWMDGASFYWLFHLILFRI